MTTSREQRDALGRIHAALLKLLNAKRLVARPMEPDYYGSAIEDALQIVNREIEKEKR